MERNLDQELLDKIDAFVKGQLKGDDLDKFNTQLEENEDLREEVKLQRQLFTSLNESDLNWNIIDEQSVSVENKIDKEDYQQMSEKIKRVANVYKNENQIKVIPLWPRLKKYAYAAAIVTILLVSFNLFKNLASKNSYQYDHTQWVAALPSYIEKGNDLTPFTKAESEFKKQNYETAITLFNAIPSDSRFYPSSQMYIGASHELLDEDEKALAAFDKLINLKEFEDHSKGLWFKAQIYLKTDQKSQAISILKVIIQDENNSFLNEAKEVLKELE